MKERIINIIKLIGALIMFFYLSTLLVTVIKYLGFTINNYQDLVVLSTTAEIIMASVIFIVYQKTFTKNLSELKGKTVINKLFKYLVIFVIVKIGSGIISSVLCLLLGFDLDVSENQKVINSYIEAAPLFMLFTTSITTPVVEEGIFRLGLKKVINNKIAFIVISGLIFGFLHIFPTDLNLTYALVTSIPYVAIGCTLAYIYTKEENIYYPMIIHGLNNLLSVILIISWKKQKIMYNRKKFWWFKVKEVLENLLGFIYSLSMGDYFFFIGTFLLIVLFIYIIYLIKCDDTEEIPQKKDGFDIEAVCKNIEKNYKPETIKLTSYEEEQENNAIISYDELIKNKDKMFINYDDEYNSPITEISVKKIDLNSEKTENTLEMPKLDVKMFEYEEEEDFLKALKQLQKDLSH